jgi:hypothetical protein
MGGRYGTRRMHDFFVRHLLGDQPDQATQPRDAASSYDCPPRPSVEENADGATVPSLTLAACIRAAWPTCYNQPDG